MLKHSAMEMNLHCGRDESTLRSRLNYTAVEIKQKITANENGFITYKYIPSLLQEAYSH